MEKIITICVCAYNVEAFLSRALDSCLIEEREKLEVLIMDDGSTDRTGEIADQYAEKYPETFVHVKKENGGWGSNLNLAVRMASGKYFKELDADDWFIKENLQKLLDTLKESDADMILTDHVYCYPDHERKNSPEWKQYANQEMLMENAKPFYFPIWDAAYKTEILKAHYLDLPQHMQYTDNLFILYILPFIKTVRFEDYVLYCYMLGRDGQSVNISSLAKHYQEILDVQNLSFSFYQNNPDLQNCHVLYKLKMTYYTFLSFFLRLYKTCDIDIGRIIKENDAFVREKIPALFSITNDNKKLVLMRKTNFMLLPFAAMIEKRKAKKEKN